MSSESTENKKNVNNKTKR